MCTENLHHRPIILHFFAHRSMQHPRPLQELPLERFLPTHPKSVRSHKRPLSPGNPNSYSPTKRRILNSEGIFAPEKMCKTPMQSGKAPLPTRFSDVLAGSASPARILDFGLPKNREGEPTKHSLPSQTQITSLSSRKTLASSPESNPRRVSSSTHHFSSEVSTDTGVSGTSSARQAIVPIIIPRELPPPPDPHSIHYPGFVVFQDTHITIYPADLDSEGVPDVEIHTDLFKENLPPHRKTLRKTTLETLKFEGTPLGKPKSMTGTPNRAISSCSPMKIDPRKKLRRMMEEDHLEEEQDVDDE